MYIRKPKKRTVNDWSYYAVLASCACVLFQLFAIPRGRTTMMSLSNRALMVIWLMLAGVALARRVEQRFPAKLAGGLVVICCTAIGYGFAVVDAPSMAVASGLRVLGFLTFPMMLLYSVIFEIDGRAKTAVLISNLLASGIFIQLYNSDKRHYFENEFGPSELDVITLGYPNPNQTALYLFLCTIALVIGVFYFKVVVLRIVFAVDAIFMARFVGETGARTAQILLIVFLLLVLVLIVRRREVPTIWVGIALFIPLLYVLVLPVASNILVMEESLFNGRESVFNRYFENLTFGTFWFGNMNFFKFENLHNGYVAIAASAGVPTCMGYAHLLRTWLKGICPRRKDRIFMRVAFIGALCAIMYTSAEAAFFVGGANYAMMLFSIFILANREEPVPSKQEEQQ